MKKQLQVGDVLNIKEMAQCIGISQKTFQNNRDKILLGLSEAYDIKLTYKEVDEISDNIAAYLFEKGVKKGDE